MKRTVSDILREASVDKTFADKAIHTLQAALRGEKLAALARRVVENERGARSEKSSSVAQRLMDLRKNREPGRRWVLSVAHPGRLQGLLDACGLSPEELAQELEHDGWHPAWPELGGADEMWLDSVPGLPDGVGSFSERVRALRPDQSLLIAGPRGIGLSHLARTIRDFGQDVGQQGESSAPRVWEVDGAEAARVLLGRLKNEERPGVVFIRAADKAEGSVAQHPPDVFLEPWTGKEIAELARRLGSTLPGRRLSDVASELWNQLGSTFAWTPREVGFVLRAVADHGTELVSLRALGPSLVEAVARSRTPDVEPALLRDAFLGICRAAYESSLGGRWPSTLGRRQIEGVIEQAGLGLPSALTSRIARHSALAAVADLKDQLRAGKRSKKDAAHEARAVETLERCLESPSAGVLLDSLVQAELLIETADGYQPAFRLAALTTAAVVEWSELADRAYEPELHPVAIAAARGADDAGSVLRAILDAGPGRAVLGLRVALALVAHGTKVHAEQARAVVGSVVAVLTSGVSCPWLDAGSDVTAHLRVASERFGDELAGELPVLDAVTAWLRLAPDDRVRLEPSESNLTASWLPFQHRSELLAASWPPSVLGDFEVRILRRALETGDARAREIASGVAPDARARELGRRLGVGERLAVLELAPPDDAYDHLNVIEYVLDVGYAGAGVRRKAYRSFLGEAEMAGHESFHFANGTTREWIEALGDARETRLLELLWKRARRMVRDALKEDPVHPGAVTQLARRLETGDSDHIKLLATTLAHVGDLGPLRTLAKLGTGPCNWNPDSDRSAEDTVRENLSRFACLKLIARPDTEGLRALLAEAIRGSHARIAIEKACEAQLDTALYAASDLDFDAAKSIVFGHLEDSRCRALTREWARASQYAVAVLLRTPADGDANVIAPWLAAEKEVWMLIPGALRHPSLAVQRLAIGWVLERTGAELDRETPDTGWLVAPESSFVIDGVATALEEHGARKKSREALRRLALLVGLGVAGIDRDYALRKLMPSLARHDVSLARSVVADVTERRGDDAGTACARAWASGAPEVAPPSILERAGHDLQAAARAVAAMSTGKLEAFVGELPADAWDDGERLRGTGLDAHPRQALGELVRRDSVRFVRVARASFERFVAEGRRSTALVVTEWIAGVDGAAAAALMDRVLASPSPQGSRNKKEGRSR